MRALRTPAASTPLYLPSLAHEPDVGEPTGVQDRVEAREVEHPSILRRDLDPPHSLRHTAITLALDAGAPLRDVQDFAGHRDARTTRRYDRAREDLDRSPTYALARWLTEHGERPQA